MTNFFDKKPYDFDIDDSEDWVFGTFWSHHQHQPRLNSVCVNQHDSHMLEYE